MSRSVVTLSALFLIALWPDPESGSRGCRHADLCSGGGVILDVRHGSVCGCQHAVQRQLSRRNIDPGNIHVRLVSAPVSAKINAASA